MAKEIELAKLKEYLKFHDLGLSNTESLGLPVLQNALRSLNIQKHFTISDVYREHEKMREILGGLRNSATDQLKKLKKGIDRVRGSSSIRESVLSVVGGSGWYTTEQESESLVHVGKTVKHLKMTMDTIFTHMDEMVQLSKESIERWQEEHLIEMEVEATVMRNLIQGMQKGFEDKLWDQYSQSCDVKFEKLNEISSLRNDLEKDQGEFDFLRKKIPEVIMKLEDISVETEKHPEFTQRPTNLDSLKAPAAAEKSRQRSLAEENMHKQIGDLNLLVEDSQIAASIKEEVYKCFLRDLIRKKGSEADESNMEFHIMNGIYDIILTEAYITAERAFCTLNLKIQRWSV
ncbi:hypothetical protein HAX54_027362 [Datura stramonium]|uniref:Uncharacterized protein n=1 Tax=Datura stramonium TaxID=4076 RepID=A0ABS8V3X6_DATST|nr:hypothetical protein [Datura stramonium]